MPGLVLEGGTFRTAFTFGVLDALLDSEIYFPYSIGVSAGAGYGISYQSRQRGRNIEIIKRFRNDKRYVGFGNFFKCRSLFGLEFAFDRVPRELIPYDIETARKSPSKFMVTVTNADTGKPEYMDTDDMELDCMMVRASCAIPLLFPAIEIGGKKYYDGGLSDPVPVRESIKNGHEKNLIVLTRPKGFRMTPSRGTKFACSVLNRKYPNLCKTMLNRPQIYNEVIGFCEQLERDGKAVILRPDYAVKSFEKDVDTLLRTAQMGYDMTIKNIEHIKKLF